ncbi:putative transcription factor interactor and regulator CCHC(Zn) family [Helianthus annuus]|nr:putative transcription factor interactor and regulator CCHC(Zn) family [Helianthus annuus]KAJ0498830.1 putative transcription factor interactor and regulator CCHC(Zn) family [Helianthus annuus]KAJ0664849.1 putative transcription factor interactor and regulator CCHC(Zn) family [Helianthus annuus]KAJ0672286.1 putative transcription factor interactor and regulator CCHC(Zn) family [Helianthus annuus]KAJ0859548.1 putative transcription factor interactor and regulator CCHC(Zn) family [Helianthus a
MLHTEVGIQTRRGCKKSQKSTCYPKIYYGISIGGIQGESQPAQHFILQTTLVSNSNSVSEQPSPASLPPSCVNPYSLTQQGCYGSSSNPCGGSTANPDIVRLDTSNFSKVSVEVVNEHTELLNTLVSSYCGLVAGQVGNINLTSEDYAHIDKEEMELIDIKWAFASAVRRAKDFMERTGRTSLESRKDSPYGFNKRMVTCLNYRENGHFKIECTKPP